MGIRGEGGQGGQGSNSKFTHSKFKIPRTLHPTTLVASGRGTPRTALAPPHPFFMHYLLLAPVCLLCDVELESVLASITA
ncbi:hypothetical protein [Chroococcidiopsis sp. CCNUC1]|uniref:hypothetical protein n=1 Tax=Chroococcidiopsis sp. CCNUC1 TaxID=2653189 RepID=UPI00201FED88|nr:hypothetical protein [Chroococcidiopsis sp. CCNUC1]URD47724.1 hypothetical protein M5J74_15415 [Chroococcidiopsis sp. CCNUC1]